MISNVHLFSPFSICTSAVFLASLCPSIYGAAFERMFMSRCLCAIIRQCRITLSLYRCPPLRFFLFCLIIIVASVMNILSSCCARSPLCTSCLQQGSNSFPAMNRTFLLSCTRSCYSMKDNQMTRSDVILL